jgi:hypothetical protein
MIGEASLPPIYPTIPHMRFPPCDFDRILPQFRFGSSYQLVSATPGRFVHAVARAAFCPRFWLEGEKRGVADPEGFR